MTTPTNWPSIHQDASGFNLALGLLLCSTAEERHGQQHPQWNRDCQLLARAVLADRPCMAGWDRQHVVAEFSLPRLAQRWRDEGWPHRPGSPLSDFMLALGLEGRPRMFGGPGWGWVDLLIIAASSKPHGARGNPSLAQSSCDAMERHHCCLSVLRVGDERPAGLWKEQWALIDCALALFKADPDLDPQAYARGQDFFPFAQQRLLFCQAREEGRVIEEACAPSEPSAPRPASRL